MVVRHVVFNSIFDHFSDTRMAPPCGDIKFVLHRSRSKFPTLSHAKIIFGISLSKKKLRNFRANLKNDPYSPKVLNRPLSTFGNIFFFFHFQILYLIIVRMSILCLFYQQFLESPRKRKNPKLVPMQNFSKVFLFCNSH